MPTPDGIGSEDWQVLFELAVELYNALEDSDEERTCRARLLSYLDQLEAKYGVLPSLLETRADFVEEPHTKESLLLRAHALAQNRKEWANALSIAHSLAELYLDEIRNHAEARVWLGYLKQHLSTVRDPYFAGEYQRLRKVWSQQFEVAKDND
jgi:hypothetical protein